MSEFFKDQPEFIELDLGESLISRTETLGQSAMSFFERGLFHWQRPATSMSPGGRREGFVRVMVGRCAPVPFSVDPTAALGAWQLPGA